MTRIALIMGSTRPGRRAEAVTDWVTATAARHPAVAAGDVHLDVIDLADYGLPLLDEPVPALFGDYRHPHTQRWAETIGSYDGFVFVTPEYNHSVPAALKNAIDFLGAEWRNKAAGFVSYGVWGGTRAVEHLRQILGELRVADVAPQVALYTFADFTFDDQEDPTSAGTCTPAEHHEPTLMEMLDEVVAWSRALRPLRATPIRA